MLDELPFSSDRLPHRNLDGNNSNSNTVQAHFPRLRFWHLYKGFSTFVVVWALEMSIVAVF